MSPEPSAKLRVLVVDDEPLARTNLAVLLRKDSDIGSVDEFGTGPEAVKSIRHEKPHILFLDVQMPECDGFDVLEMLGSDLPPAIIFVTAYDQYALRAFEAGALDYLLKPFDNPRFELALKRAKEKVAASSNAPQKQDRIAVKSAGEVLFLKLEDIDWIEAADYYAGLHVAGRSHLVRRSLSELEQELPPTAFCRIHRSTIVNLERIRGLKLNADGDYDVLLDRGVKLRLSRRYRKQLRWRMGLKRPAGPV